YSLLHACRRAGGLRARHSFPTRRSSDLVAVLRRRGAELRGAVRRTAELRGEVVGVRIRSPDGRRAAGCVGAFRALPTVSCAGSRDRKSTRLNSSHVSISYAVFCLKKKKS